MSKIYLFLALLVLGTVSCGDFIEEYSQNLSYVNTVEDLEEVLIGDAYWVNVKGGANFYLYFLNVMDDDVSSVTFSHNTSSVGYRLRKFYTWQADPWAKDEDKDKIYGTNASWAAFYKKIAICNSVLNDVERFTDDKLYNQIKGEALFLRAFYYFYMVNMWGEPYDKKTADSKLGVPIKISSEVEDKDFARNTVQECYDRIVRDAEAAATCLAGVYPSSTKRAGIHAVKALLSRVYLYMGDYENTIKCCNDVLNDSRNLSVLDFNTLSVSEYSTALKSDNCAEYIFNATNGMNWRGSSGYRYAVSGELMDCYKEDTGDWRFKEGKASHFFAYYGYSTPIYSRYPMDNATCVFIGYGFNYPEIYLNKAEAEAMLDHSGEAIAALNGIREKRIQNPASIDGLSGEELVKFVRDERRRELSFLYHRWFDLRRYAVAPKYPEATAIRHEWNAIDSDLENGTYVLNPYPGDGGWVLPFPAYVLEDNHGVLVDNDRPERSPVE